MKRKRLWIGVAVLVCLAGVALLITRFALPKENPRDYINKVTERVEAALGEEWLKDRETEVKPITLSDADGNTIIYYVITTKYYNEVPDTVELSDVLNGLIYPDTVEGGRACKVCDLDAMIWEKDDRSFLCWTVSPECTLAIEYSPDAVSEADIFRMAESIPASSGEGNSQ